MEQQKNELKDAKILWTDALWVHHQSRFKVILRSVHSGILERFLSLSWATFFGIPLCYSPVVVILSWSAKFDFVLWIYLDVVCFHVFYPTIAGADWFMFSACKQTTANTPSPSSPPSQLYGRRSKFWDNKYRPPPSMWLMLHARWRLTVATGISWIAGLHWVKPLCVCV